MPSMIYNLLSFINESIFCTEIAGYSTCTYFTLCVSFNTITTMGACARILARRATRGRKKTEAVLERKSCWRRPRRVVASSSTIAYYTGRRRLSTAGLTIPTPAPRSVEEEEEAARRATADKRRWGIKRQRLRIERWRRQCREGKRWRCRRDNQPENERRPRPRRRHRRRRL